MANDEAFRDTEFPRREPLPDTVAARIRSMVKNGNLAPGSRLPNELQLAQDMRVSRATIRAALELLREQGLVWWRHGVGTFVSEKPLLVNRLDINSGIGEVIRSMGFTPGCRDVRVTVNPADDYAAQQLRIAPTDSVVHVERTRTADEKQVAASIDILALTALQHGSRRIDLAALKAAMEAGRSLYDVFREDLNTIVDHGIAKIKPVKATARQLKELHLDIPSGSTMLYLEQVDYDREQNPILFSREYHAADFSVFTVYRR
jgi:GntR family transcriptional regulator